MNRLPPLERGKRPLINEIQADLHPWEVLFDVKKLLTVLFVSHPLDHIFDVSNNSMYAATTSVGLL